ncbi:hypothetical protein ACA910_011335 [Epithemia clementina (nom. ined.)]
MPSVQQSFNDMHGDAQKNTCQLATLTPNPLTGLSAGHCTTFPAVPSITNARSHMVEASLLGGDDPITQKIAGETYNNISPKLVGSMQCFSQLEPGVGVVNDATIGEGAKKLGALFLGAKVINNKINARVSIQAVVVNASSETGVRGVPGVETALIEPCFLPVNICLHEQLLIEWLIGLVGYID